MSATDNTPAGAVSTAPAGAVPTLFREGQK